MTGTLSPEDTAKRAAAAAALELVAPGMALGLGTGSTAKWFVDLLGARGHDGPCVPTSSRTRAQAEGLGLQVTTLEAVPALDLVVDGADEVDPAFNLIKGGGGALLQEKIVASASSRMVVIADASKTVPVLGAFALPVEVVRFGWAGTLGRIARVLADHGAGDVVPVWRGAPDDPFVTDEGHYIADLAMGSIADPPALDAALAQVTGVVETGLFCGIAETILIGRPDGSVTRHDRSV